MVLAKYLTNQWKNLSASLILDGELRLAESFTSHERTSLTRLDLGVGGCADRSSAAVMSHRQQELSEEVTPVRLTALHFVLCLVFCKQGNFQDRVKAWTHNTRFLTMFFRKDVLSQTLLSDVSRVSSDLKKFHD